MICLSKYRAALAIGVASTAIACAGSAQAQDQDPAATAAATAALEEPLSDIVVTGTRVARDGYQAPTPLTVLTQEDIENSSPTNNIADFVNELPQLAGSTRPSNSRLNLSSGQAGINALNLRNLGEVRTLVLVDGRRSVASTVTGIVDVNTIPQALVQRVEISTGGASAAYGSDAVAGVVNFILDKGYTGLKMEADAGITDRGDDFNYSGSVTGGFDFAGGRGHVLLNGELAHTDGIFSIGLNRAWNQRGYVRIQDPKFTATSTTPRYLIRTMVGAANSTPGGLITSGTLFGKYFDVGGTIRNYQFGALTFPATGSPSLTQGGDWRVNDSGRRIGLDPRDDRYGLFGRVSYEVADGVTAFAEGGYNQQKIFFNAGPNLSTGQTILPTNAFLIRTLLANGLPLVTTNQTLATTALDLPFRAIDNRRSVQRYVVGLEGETPLFGKPSVWNLYAQLGKAKLQEQLRNIMNIDRLANATNAVFSVPGNYSSPIVCAINADASTTNDDPACRPLNRLGIGVADPAAIAYVLGDPYRDEQTREIDLGANLSLSPFATWAGDVSFAVGAEYRQEKITGFVPTQFQPVQTVSAAGLPQTRNLYSVGNFLPTNGKYNVKEAYLETVVPLGFGLEFNGAVRATDYSTSGSVVTWKAGAVWQPIEDIRLRVTRSRDIRAPNLNELYQGGSANTDSVSNPFYNAASNTATPLNGVVYNTASIGYSGFVTGNPNLSVEKADSWNIGGVLTPRFLPGFSFSADYFRIDLKNAIDTISAQEIINRCFTGVTTFCDAISADPSNASRILIRSQPFNYVRRLVRGIDFDAGYRMPVDRLFAGAGGALNFHGIATRYIENLADTGIAGSVPVNTVGANGGQASTPKWIYRFSAGYDDDSISVTGTARGVSAGKYVANGIECQTNCPISTTNFPTYERNHASGTFYVDLNLTFKFDTFGDKRGEFFLNVTNLFDADPIVLPETGLAANSTYSDLIGRAFRAGVRINLR